MFNKNTYFAAILSVFSIPMVAVAPAALNKVEAHVQLQVGNRVGESIITISSEKYTQLSMDNESLGFALKLVDATEGNERFETTPTYNEEPIANFFRTGKKTTIGAGCNLNGHSFEKQLIIEFLAVKKIS